MQPFYCLGKKWYSICLFNRPGVAGAVLKQACCAGCRWRPFPMNRGPQSWCWWCLNQIIANGIHMHYLESSPLVCHCQMMFSAGCQMYYPRIFASIVGRPSRPTLCNWPVMHRDRGQIRPVRPQTNAPLAHVIIPYIQQNIKPDKTILTYREE